MHRIGPALRSDIIEAFTKHGWTGKQIAGVIGVNSKTVQYVITRYLDERREKEVILRGVPSRINEELARMQYRRDIIINQLPRAASNE